MKSRQGIGQHGLITFLFCGLVIFNSEFRKNSGSPWKHLPPPPNVILNRTKTNSIFKTDRLFGLPYRQHFNYITAANSKKRRNFLYPNTILWMTLLTETERRSLIFSIGFPLYAAISAHSSLASSVITSFSDFIYPHRNPA